MSCREYTDYGEALVDGKFFDAVYCPIGDQIGGALFALLFFGAIGIALYVYTDSVAVPLVVTIFAGSVAITQLDAIVVNTTVIVVMLAGTGISYLLVRRIQANR